jgi:hypothetical protein
VSGAADFPGHELSRAPYRMGWQRASKGLLSFSHFRHYDRAGAVLIGHLVRLEACRGRFRDPAAICHADGNQFKFRFHASFRAARQP